MNIITWNDEQMSVGLDSIDTQHKELVRIINSFANALDNNKEQEILSDTIEELIDYTKYHFSLEEDYFEKFDFDEKDLHKKEHAYFINYLFDLKGSLDLNANQGETSNASQSLDILKHLIEWFVAHISGKDRKYIELFKVNGII